MAQSVLQQVRKFAKMAKQMGKEWRIKKNGAIACKRNACTVGAIAYALTQEGQKQQSNLRKQYAAMVSQMQKQYQKFVAQAEKAGHEVDTALNLDAEPYFHNDLSNGDVEKWPGGIPDVMAEVGMSDKVFNIIVEANDMSLKHLLEGGEDKHSDVYKARQILEEVLIH